MANETSRNVRLGAFVAAGTLLLITALYLIGNKQNLFGSTVSISARFYNVSGLMKGNNVRFAGIDVGTVESVNIENDSTVLVVMLIDESVRRFIKKNSVASVGTDGLMGNKLVNIIAGKVAGAPVEDGDELFTRRPPEMDDMVQTLSVTNENMKVISDNLRDITGKLNSSSMLWNLLLDTVVAQKVRSTVVNLHLMSNDGIRITGDLRALSSQLKTGKGTLGALITDTLLSHRISQTVVKLEMLSDTAGVISGEISGLVKGLKQGKGSLGVLLTDTTLIHNLNKSVLTIDTAAGNFNQNMEALKHTWPLKKYFRKNPEKK